MFTDRTTKRWRGSRKRQSARKNPGMYGYGMMAAALVMAAGLTGCGEAKEVALARTESSNPIVKTDEGGERIYGGDPSVLVDGDTVYLYTGHDASTDEQVANSVYEIPEYLCYSSTDLVNWKSEGTVMTMDTVDWAKDDVSAWASQVMKYNDKYYLYYCSWDKSGKQSIGVAVADSPTGTFVDIGEPLVRGSVTKPQLSTFNDIDPTVWVETDENGEEHRYLAWGNGMFFMCELNEDMISVKDMNGDGEITSGTSFDDADIMYQKGGIENYTEAPWLYRRSDELGNYYGDYYLFYAYGWRECMAYATAPDLTSGDWTFGNVIMYPTSTSNTNHMAVFDFKGKTYFVYHNGSLQGGNGYRRSACITELHFNDDGSIDYFEETTAGLAGTTVTLQSAADDGALLSHEGFVNSPTDADYPMKKVKVGTGLGDLPTDEKWVLCDGKADASNEYYVSIQSENKSGLYLTAQADGTVVLAQDVDAAEETAQAQTFHSMEGLSDKKGVSFESVLMPGQYLTLQDGKLVLTDGSDKKASTFYLN